MLGEAWFEFERPSLARLFLSQRNWSRDFSCLLIGRSDSAICRVNTLLNMGTCTGQTNGPTTVQYGCSCSGGSPPSSKGFFHLVASSASWVLGIFSVQSAEEKWNIAGMRAVGFERGMHHFYPRSAGRKSILCPHRSPKGTGK